MVPCIYRTKQEWSYLPIVRYLTFGFKNQQLTLFFDSIPPYVAHEFKGILQKVQVILCQRIDNLTAFKNISTILSNYFEDFNDEAEIWNEQNICGYLRTNVDVASQEHFGMKLNNKIAEYAGTNCDEFMKLVADSNLSLSFQQIDVLFLLIHETKHTTQCRTDRFQKRKLNTIIIASLCLKPKIADTFE